ncbi:MAG: glycosyltransferase [Acidobacteria bacterium]|nr:glycosyltransferase [Acidobacteriota bacterium]
MARIRIWFTDFWGGFDPRDNYLVSVLGKHFDLEVNPRADVLVHCVFGWKHLRYACPRVCFTVENTRPDYRRSDYHVGFDLEPHPRYLRWPVFLCYYPPGLLLGPRDIDGILKRKTRFCGFVVSNPNARERIDLFHALSAYRRVDSGGRVLNTLGCRVPDKVAFLRECRFAIAYENSSHPGYTTEKIYEAFLAGAVPIYWGSPRVEEDFNPAAFINAHRFASLGELVDHVRIVDRDEALYRGYLSEPCFAGDKVPEAFREERLVAFFDGIFASGEKVSRVARPTDRALYLAKTVQKGALDLFRKITGKKARERARQGQAPPFGKPLPGTGESEG